MMNRIIRKSLWPAPRPHTSTIGFRPTSTIAPTGSRPSSRAHFHTSTMIARLAATRIPFSAQNEPATPSGTTAKVSSVNSGP